MSVRRRGFTLVEVLLAAALMSVVALAVGHVVGLCHRAQRSVRANGDFRSLAAAVDRRLSSDLRALVPPGGLYAAGLVGEDAVGAGGEALVDPERARAAFDLGEADELPLEERDTLTLAVFPPARAFGEDTPPGEGALWKVVYSIDDDPETPARGLVRTVTRIRDQPAGVDPPDPEPIAPEVVAMDLAFFDGEGWVETWDSGASDTLPLAVRVRLVFDRGDALVRHDVLVAPPTARPAALPEAVQ